MGKTLKADIVVGGKADQSFYNLGKELEGIGSIINGASEKLITFGKESVKAYVSYEDAMLDAEVALHTQYTSASELGKVMETLNKSALQWASDSRFTTNDVASAISNAAHAGWDLEQILTGVPDAMTVSLAGGMDLAQGLEYLVDISNAAGLSIDDLGGLVDTWAYAANRSSTTIPEMGAAMQKMGATMQFVKGDMAGLTTMLAVLADNGAKGTEAGTLLRNSMIRMIAPTKAAASAMDGLRLSAEDLDDIYSNQSGLDEVSKLLEAAGFNAYDSEGKLKSFLNIFAELNEATGGMTEEDRNKVLSTIFPTRTITGALALLDAASTEWDGLYGDIKANADGYAEYASEKMESGLGGSLRHLESVYNALQTRTGSALADSVGGFADKLSGMIESVNSMDDTAFSAIVAGLETIAVAGPALMTAGGALNLIEAIAATGPVGGIALAGTALAAFAFGLDKVDEGIYKNQFGELALDTEVLQQYLSGLNTELSNTEKGIEAYGKAVEDAFLQYSQGSGSLKGGLLTAALTNASLSKAEINNWYQLGDQLGNAMISGIQNSYSEAMASAGLFSDGGMLGGLMDTMTYGYNQAIATAESLSADLRSAMTSAFADGTLTTVEIGNIQAILDQQNELMALVADAQNQTEREKMLRQAQSLGIDSLSQIGALVTGQRDTELSRLQDNYWTAYTNAQIGGKWKIQNGVAGYTQESLDAELNALGLAYNQKFRETSAQYDEILLNTALSTLQGSDVANAWNALAAIGANANQNGFLDTGLYDEYTSGYGFKERRAVSTFLDDLVSTFGGLEGITDKIGFYSSQGNVDMESAFSQIAAMYGAVNNLGSDIPVVGDTKPLENDIKAAAKTPVTATVNGDTSALEQAIAQYDGMSISVNVGAGRFSIPKLYAEGGRATEPGVISEFGQPEWAIPEAHTQRTAELLDAARAASGFTWPELLSRNGGLNAGGSGGNYTIVYSPTINASNAAGVEQVLAEDKNRLDKWMRDKKLREDLEVYS